MAVDRTQLFLFSEREQRTLRELLGSVVKIRPFDVTLSVAGTAEDLINITAPTPPALNLVTNPSMETSDPPASWTAVGSTLSRVAVGVVAPRTSSNSMQIITDNAAANEGAYFESTNVPPGYYALSVYLQRTGGGTAQIRASSDGGVSFTDGNVVTMNATWQRSTLIHHISGGVNANLRLYIVTNSQQSITYFAEDAQMEPAWDIVIGNKNTRDNPPSVGVTAFVDPASDRFSRWLGTADGSQSIREPSIGEIHSVHLVAHSNDIYIDFDRNASSSLSLFLAEGNNVNGAKVVKERISFVNATVGETPRVRGWVLGS